MVNKAIELICKVFFLIAFLLSACEVPKEEQPFDLTIEGPYTYEEIKEKEDSIEIFYNKERVEELWQMWQNSSDEKNIHLLRVQNKLDEPLIIGGFSEWTHFLNPDGYFYYYDPRDGFLKPKYPSRGDVANTDTSVFDTVKTEKNYLCRLFIPTGKTDFVFLGDWRIESNSDLSMFEYPDRTKMRHPVYLFEISDGEFIPRAPDYITPELEKTEQYFEEKRWEGIDKKIWMEKEAKRAYPGIEN